MSETPATEPEPQSKAPEGMTENERNAAAKLKEASDIVQNLQRLLQETKTLSRGIADDFETKKLVPESVVKNILHGLFLAADGHVNLQSVDVSDIIDGTIAEAMAYVADAIAAKDKVIATRKYDLGFEAGKAYAMRRIQTAMTDVLNDIEETE